MFSFKRALPQECNVNPEDILNVIKELDEKSVPMHSLLIMKNDCLIFEKYYAPYGPDTLHRMFSISKSFTAVAIALLKEEGKLDLDDPITDYFPEYVDENTHPYIRMTTIRNMLMMRSCHASTTYKVDMKSDWVESFFKVTPTHRPGTVFHYDTSAAHVLCALAEKLSGTDMLTYMKDRLLKHVDFSADSYMVKDPFGVSIGGSGLMATPMDIMKFLYILARNGNITCSDGQKRQLLSADFIREATSNLSDNLVTGPLPSEQQGYGMQIWRNERGGFTLYGMGGQLGISIPSEDMLIMTTADTQGMQGGNQLIYNALFKNLVDEKGKAPLSPSSPEVPITYDGLIAYADTLSIMPPRLPKSYDLRDGSAPINDHPYQVPSEIRSSLDKESSISYALAENPGGFTSLKLCLPETGQCTLSLTRGSEAHSIFFCLGEMANGLFPIYGTPYTAGGIWLRENVLYIRVHLIGESVGSVHFQLFFEENGAVLYMKKIEETYFKEFDGHLCSKK